MRSPRSHPLGGLRRVQRCGVRWPDRGLEEPHPDHHGRLLPKRRADRPQGQGGRGAGAGPGGRRRGREGAGVAPPRRPVRIEEPHGGRPRLLRRRGVEGLPSAGDRTGLHAGRGAVVHHVFEWDDRPAQGLPTQHGRVPLLRRRHLEVLPGHPPQRHVLVLRRHRVDHGALLHRVRAPGARHDERDVRGGPHLPGSRPALADRRTAGGDHLPHRPHHDPHAPQARTGGAQEVRLSLQTHDDGGRTDRAGRLALVPRCRGQGGGHHRRHLVADRERRVPGEHLARAPADEARELRAGGAWGVPLDLRRRGHRGRSRQRPGRQYLHPQPVAGHLPDHLGRPGAVREHVLREVQPGQGEQGLA